MATIREKFRIAAPPADVWDAVRDFDAPHRRLTPGILTAAKRDGDRSRVVTFANGMVAREILIDANETYRRLAYAVVGKFEHHSASIQVYGEGNQAVVVWITDVLPQESAALVGDLMKQGAAAMKRTLESAVQAA